MAASIKRLGKETLIYGTSTVLARLLNFCLVPFYTYYLLPGDYDIIATTFAVIALLNVLFLFGMDQSYLRFASEQGQKTEVFHHCFYSVLINGVFLSLLLWLFAKPFAALIGIGTSYAYIIHLAVWVLLLDVLNMIPFTKLRLERRPWYFAGVRTASIIVNVLGNIFFIAVLHKGIASILWANIFASLTSLLLLSPVLWKELLAHKPQFNKTLFNNILHFAWPFVPSGLASLLISVIDKPILVHLVGLDQVGIYQANFKIGVFMMLLVSMFDQAWRPFFLAHASEPDAKQTFARVLTCFVALGTWFLLGLCLLMPTIIQSNLLGHFHLISPAYWSGLNVIPYVLTGYFFYGLYVNFMVGPVMTKKTRVLLWITLLGALSSITTNLLLVPHIGILGAGWAVAISYGAMATALFCFTQKNYTLPYQYAKLAQITLCALSVAVLTYVAGKYIPGSALSVKVILLSAYPLCMA
ncbi:MAG: oligosaccharide flippase family protein, partial [Elusimicrobiaceae bacterium]|nr:oligosaccharide flippase family protein [Elusimicrobiaceae bacterium]